MSRVPEGASRALSQSVTIYDPDKLYRFVTDENIGPDGKVQSNAFSGGTGYISIDIAKETQPEVSVERLNKPGVRLAVFLALAARELDQEPTHVPLPGFYSHAELRGNNPKLTQSVRRKLAKKCCIVEDVVSKGSEILASPS